MSGETNFVELFAKNMKKLRKKEAVSGRQPKQDVSELSNLLTTEKGVIPAPVRFGIGDGLLVVQSWHCETQLQPGAVGHVLDLTVGVATNAPEKLTNVSGFYPPQERKSTAH